MNDGALSRIRAAAASLYADCLAWNGSRWAEQLTQDVERLLNTVAFIEADSRGVCPCGHCKRSGK